MHEVDNDYRIKTIQNRTEYPNLIEAAWRFEISNRAVCVLGNAMLNDLGIMIFQYQLFLILGFLNDSNRLCHSKVQRMFEKYGCELASEIDGTRKEVICLMFDGRKDQSLIKTILSNRGDI